MRRNLPDGAEAAHREHAALAILRLLDGDVLRGAANDHLLQGLLERLGLRLPTQIVRDVIGLLERAGALTSTEVRGLVVVELTRRGAEIARGLVDQEGVAHVDPDCPY